VNQLPFQYRCEQQQCRRAAVQTRPELGQPGVCIQLDKGGEALFRSAADGEAPLEFAITFRVLRNHKSHLAFIEVAPVQHTLWRRWYRSSDTSTDTGRILGFRLPTGDE
jgi:hypothetical protein